MDSKNREEEIQYAYDFIIKILNIDDPTPRQKQELWDVLDYLAWAVINK